MVESAVIAGGVVRGKRNPLHATLAQRLKSSRQEAQLSGRALCAAAGLSRGMCGHIESGTIPSIDTAERLARALQLSPCFLAYGVEGPALATLAEGEPLRSAGMGGRLATLRQHQGLSLKALGAAAGLADVTVSAVESGANFPSVDTAERLAVALGCSPCWLAYGEGPDPIADPQGAAAAAQRVKYRPPRPPASSRRRPRPPAPAPRRR